VGDSVKRLHAGCGLAAALLLLAACGGQSSSVAPSHAPPASASPSPSAEPTASESEATVHPPILPSPAPSSASYATASDAERFVSGNGLAAVAPEMTWRPAAVLHVIHATGTNSASSQGDWYFFFARGRLVGQQFFSRAAAQNVVDDATFAVTYNVFRPGDPHCCSSGGQATVRFHWDGSRLIELDPIPGPIQT
jgi:LppP/LprE lipoprotein